MSRWLLNFQCRGHLIITLTLGCSSRLGNHMYIPFWNLSLIFPDLGSISTQIHVILKIYWICNFVSRVGLVSKCVDQVDVELIWFDKEYIFLLLQAFVRVIFLLLLLLELLFCLLVASSFVTVGSGDRNITTVIFFQ